MLTRVVSVWNASTLRSHITCMYSLRLSPSGILISMGGESEALRLLDADARLLQRRLFLAEFDGGNAAFHGAHAVQVFIQFVLVVLGQFPAKVFGAAEDEVQHLPIERVRLADVSGSDRSFRRAGSARCAD